GGVAALRRRGLTPTEAIGVRPAARPVTDARPAERANVRRVDELRSRRAEPADLDIVTRLGLHVVRYDAQVSNATERLGTEAALACDGAGWVGGVLSASPV